MLWGLAVQHVELSLLLCSVSLQVCVIYNLGSLLKDAHMPLFLALTKCYSDHLVPTVHVSIYVHAVGRHIPISGVCWV